jgi:hypothetical protein
MSRESGSEPRMAAPQIFVLVLRALEVAYSNRKIVHRLVKIDSGANFLRRKSYSQKGTL